MPVFQVDTCKDRIASSLETLRPTTSWERNSGAVQGLDGVFLGGRGFRSVMKALFNYLGSEYGNTFALVRVFAFLSGAPDIGADQLDTKRYGEQYTSRREDADQALLPEQTPFYKDLYNDKEFFRSMTLMKFGSSGRNMFQRFSVLHSCVIFMMI